MKLLSKRKKGFPKKRNIYFTFPKMIHKRLLFLTNQIRAIPLYPYWLIKRKKRFPPKKKYLTQLNLSFFNNQQRIIPISSQKEISATSYFQSHKEKLLLSLLSNSIY